MFTRSSSICDMYQSYVPRLIHVWYDSFIRDMTTLWVFTPVVRRKENMALSQTLGIPTLCFIKKSILKHLYYEAKFNYITKNIFEKMINRLLFRNYEKHVQKPSQNIIKNIDRHFQYSNKRFFDKYCKCKGIDIG